MASISTSKTGRRYIQFVAPDGRRKTVPLGKWNRKTAQAICRHVEELLAAKLSGQPIPQDTAAWLGRISPQLHDRLARVGLIKAQKRALLGEFLEAYIANRRPTAAANTVKNLEQAQRRLLDYFGPTRDLASITPAEAETWAADLARKYAPATVGRTVRRARQFFRAAVRNKLIAENPFTDVKAAGQVNKDRQCFVPREAIYRAIKAAPDAEWRLIIALSRFGGLRCPSEHLALRWEDVLWDRNRFYVPSPKTGGRWVPIFPELRPYLEECFKLAQPGQVHVINRYRDSNANLRTQFMRIIRRAGLTPWPRLFHALRASRQTELAAEFPLHLVCSWIGNTAAIAARHYLTVQDEDFDRAAARAAKSDALALQNPMQQATAGDGVERNLSPQVQDSFHDKPLVAEVCQDVHKRPVPRVGVEQPQDSLWKTAIRHSRAAESAALADLLARIEALPPAQRAELVRWLTGKG